MSYHIKEFLDNLLSRQDNWQLQLLQSWPSIVGLIKTKVELLKIHDDTLVIGVLDSCWLQELYLLSPLLLQKINEHLETPRIKKLRFKAIGTQERKTRNNSDLYNKQVKNKITLTPQEQAILLTIQDEQLRTVMKNYLIRCHQQRE